MLRSIYVGMPNLSNYTIPLAPYRGDQTPSREPRPPRHLIQLRHNFSAQGRGADQRARTPGRQQGR